MDKDDPLHKGWVPYEPKTMKMMKDGLSEKDSVAIKAWLTEQMGDAADGALADLLNPDVYEALLTQHVAMVAEARAAMRRGYARCDVATLTRAARYAETVRAASALIGWMLLNKGIYDPVSTLKMQGLSHLDLLSLKSHAEVNPEKIRGKGEVPRGFDSWASAVIEAIDQEIARRRGLQ